MREFMVKNIGIGIRTDFIYTPIFIVWASQVNKVRPMLRVETQHQCMDCARPLLLPYMAHIMQILRNNAG